MLTSPEERIALSATFSPEFSKPVWVLAQVLLAGAILSPHKRTVTAALRAMRLSEERHFDKYHRVLNRDKWSGLRLSQILYGCPAPPRGMPNLPPPFPTPSLWFAVPCSSRRLFAHPPRPHSCIKSRPG
ncbi:MAG: transposase [Aggregatilineales bacterium]